MNRLKLANRAVSLCLSVVLLFSAMSLAVCAWFALRIVSDEPLLFQGGELKSNITVDMATVPSARYAEGTTEPDRAYLPDESARAYETLQPAGPDDLFGLIGMQKGDDSMLILDDLGNVTFGVVDNLSNHRPDNIIYLRVTIPKNTGNTVDFKMEYVGFVPEDDSTATEEKYTSTHATLYNSQGENGAWQIESDETIKHGFLAVEHGITGADGTPHDPECYLQYAYCFSAESIDATALAAAEQTTTATDEGGNPVTVAPKLTFGELYDFNAFIGAAEGAATHISAACPDDVLAASGDNYYLYIKITPNLTAIGLSVDSIIDIMSCLMDFNIRAEFEVYQKEADAA